MAKAGLSPEHALLARTGARTSLKYPRLRNALAGGDERPYRVLLRELYPTILVALKETGGDIFDLPRAVSKELEALGDETVLEEKKPLLAAEFADLDLAEVERQLSLEQDRRRLQRWVEDAGLSKQEQKVYELDLRTDHDTAAIAERLDVSAPTIRGVRRRYRNKLKEQMREEQSEPTP